MEHFMKHFVHAILHAKPEDIVTSFDDYDDYEDDEEYEDEQNVQDEKAGSVDDDEDVEEAFDYSTDDDLPDFLVRATNVYRTDCYIVRQQVMYKNDALLGAYLCSKDTFFCRTPERDRLYALAFPKREEADGKRIRTLMYVRKYID